MEWIVKTFQQYPELAIFLTLALGYWVGSLKFGKFSLGAVTGVLLAGVLVGQMHITISPNVKSVFFIMFLFAVGYGVGPQFFRGLKSDGVPQVIFSVLQCLASLITAYRGRPVFGLRHRRSGRVAVRITDDLRSAGSCHGCNQSAQYSS